VTQRCFSELKLLFHWFSTVVSETRGCCFSDLALLFQ